MKNINLKNIMIVKNFLFFITFVTFFSFGCTQKNVADNSSDVKKLNENKAYIKLILETRSFLHYLSETAKSQSLNLPDVIKNLNNLREKNLSFKDQMIEIDRIYKTNVSSRLLIHMQTYSEKWPEINKIYKNISIQVLESEAAEIINDSLQTNFQLSTQYQIKSNSTDSNTKVINYNGGCGWRYSLCVGAATVVAILCHAGCDTTALAATAGLGIPACVLACGSLQLYGGLECYENYCNSEK